MYMETLTIAGAVIGVTEFIKRFSEETFGITLKGSWVILVAVVAGAGLGVGVFNIPALDGAIAGAVASGALTASMKVSERIGGGK